MCIFLYERFESLEVGSRTVLSDRNMRSVNYKPVSFLETTLLSILVTWCA